MNKDIVLNLALTQPQRDALHRLLTILVADVGSNPEFLLLLPEERFEDTAHLMVMWDQVCDCPRLMENDGAKESIHKLFAEARAVRQRVASSGRN